MDQGLHLTAWESNSKYGSGQEGLEVNRDTEGLQSVPFKRDYANWGTKNEDPPKRKVLGLGVLAFWIAVTVLVIILAGAIGGGVAGGLAGQKKNSTSSPQTSISTSTSSNADSTPTPTTASQKSSSTTSTPTTSAALGGASPVILSPCTNSLANNGTILTALDATGVAFTGENKFQVLCNTNFPSGAAYGNPNTIDLYHMWVPDMQSCIAVCMEWNLGYAVTNGGTPACAVAAVVRQPGDYCYLKSAAGVNNTSTSNGAAIDVAVLM